MVSPAWRQDHRLFAALGAEVYDYFLRSMLKFQVASSAQCGGELMWLMG